MSIFQTFASALGKVALFRPELTYGYQAEIGAKPPRQLQLFLLLEQQLQDEKDVIELIRDFENQVGLFESFHLHFLLFSLNNLNCNCDF